jgi:hypothetical protein
MQLHSPSTKRADPLRRPLLCVNLVVVTLDFRQLHVEQSIYLVLDIKRTLILHLASRRSHKPDAELQQQQHSGKTATSSDAAGFQWKPQPRVRAVSRCLPTRTSAVRSDAHTGRRSKAETRRRCQYESAYPRRPRAWCWSGSGWWTYDGRDERDHPFRSSSTRTCYSSSNSNRSTSIDFSTRT